MRVSAPVAAIGPSGRSRIVADIDGVPLWYESADVALDPAPEAFASAVLLAAATRAEPLSIDAPLDRVWLANVPALLAQARAWWGLAEIAVSGSGTAERVRAAGGVAAQCFTGGVDSFHALLRSASPPGALVFVHGYDIPRSDRTRLDAFLPGFRETAGAVGARPIVVETNLREHPAMRRVDWERSHGGALAAVGHALAGVADTLIVPSSYPYHDAKPWGTHWDLDPLWSSAALEVRHADATLRRDGKVREIAADPLVRRHVRVCWENRAPTGNCSRCEKCVRTLLAFAMAGRLDDLPAFDMGVPVPARLDELAPVATHLVSVYEDLLRRIDDPSLAAAVERLIARSRRSRFAIARWWERATRRRRAAAGGRP